MASPKYLYLTFPLPSPLAANSINIWQLHQVALKLCYLLHAASSINNFHLTTAKQLFNLTPWIPPMSSLRTALPSLLFHSLCTAYPKSISYISPSVIWRWIKLIPTSTTHCYSTNPLFQFSLIMLPYSTTITSLLPHYPCINLPSSKTGLTLF